MPNYPALVKRLRANLDKYPGFVNLNAESATAIETLLARQRVLVDEVEAGRAWRDSNAPGGSDRSIALNIAWRETRAATDAAFPEGLRK